MTEVSAIRKTDITKERTVVVGTDELRRYAEDAKEISGLSFREVAERDPHWRGPSAPQRLVSGKWENQFKDPAPGLVRVLRALGYRVELCWRVSPLVPITDPDRLREYRECEPPAGTDPDFDIRDFLHEDIYPIMAVEPLTQEVPDMRGINVEKNRDSTGYSAHIRDFLDEEGYPIIQS